ncbi:Uncharacterised protein [Pseudomonas fluorescens]|uniref:Uncharacterized protein n=1 Tax=Pseudomonas fluorescens TaxID=294 RepID=A0A379I9A3_PSEFL|nr:Uncharacterised protein [Pseudomonas fluorescens]
MEAQLQQVLIGLVVVPLPKQQARSVVDNAVTVSLYGTSI